MNDWYLKIAYAFIANQVAIKRAAIFLLMFINILLWVGGIVLWTNYLTATPQYNATMAVLNKNLIDYDKFRVAHQPLAPQVITSGAVENVSGKFDYYAKVINPNTNWAITKLEYRFVYDGGATQPKQAFFLPNQEKYVFDFLEDGAGFPANLQLEILTVNWLRISAEESAKMSEILSGLTLVNEKIKNIEQGTIVSFEAKNNTPYSFWEVGYQVVLFDGQSPLAINYVSVDKFASATSQDLQASWFTALSDSAGLEIISDVNLLDSGSFMPVEGQLIKPYGLE